MATNKSFGTFAEVDSSLSTILTGEMWDVSIGDLGLDHLVASVDGLPVVQLQAHEVTFKNKTLYFSKHAITNGTLSITCRNDAASVARRAVEENFGTKTRNGQIDGVLCTRLAAGSPVINVYKSTGEIARTYKFYGAILVDPGDTLSLTESDGAPSDYTFSINFTDFEIEYK